MIDVTDVTVRFGGVTSLDQMADSGTAHRLKTTPELLHSAYLLRTTTESLRTTR